MSQLLRETKENLLAEIGLGEGEFPLIDQLQQQESRYLRDLKINVSNCLNYETINRKEALLIAYSVALNEKCTTLAQSIKQKAEEEGANETELTEIASCVSLLVVNNTFYRFRHFAGKDYYNQTPAGIRMSIMGNPVLGKEFFELVSLVISSLNGCELCVKSHEESVLRHGASEARIMDAIRIGSIFRGLTVMLQ